MTDDQGLDRAALDDLTDAIGRLTVGHLEILSTADLRAMHRSLASWEMIANRLLRDRAHGRAPALMTRRPT